MPLRIKADAMRDIFKQAVVSGVLMSALVLAEPLQPLTIPGPDSEPQQPNARQLEAQARALAEQVLDRRQAVVRLFRDWRNKPADFELVRAPIKSLSLELDSLKSIVGQGRDSVFVVALGSDQTDKAVAMVMADFVTGRVYQDGQKLHIWPPWSSDSGCQFWTFVDAMGSPIPQATVEIRLRDWDQWEQGAEVSLCKSQLDEKGRLKRLKTTDYPSKLAFVVSHPNYGTALLRHTGPLIENASETYVVPLVPLDSEAASRSVQAVVIDNNGNPVEGTIVSCGNLQEPSGRSIERRLDITGQAVSNEQGWFAMYVPTIKNGALNSELIPVRSTYRLSIEPPKSLNLRSIDNSFLAGAQTTVTLTTMRTDEFFHTFVFEDMNGPITDPAELKRIKLTLYRDGKEWMLLKYDDFQQGINLPTGSLTATTTRWGYSFQFDPIELTPDSPENLVFRPQPPLIFRGRVANIETNEPMADTFVTSGSFNHYKDPSLLSAQDWDRLRTKALLQTDQSPSNKTLYDSDRVIVTDVNGCYELTLMPGWHGWLGSLGAVAKGYMAEPVSTQYKPNADRVVTVPTIFLKPIESELPLDPNYAPKFIFEDESDPIVDPDFLKVVCLIITDQYGGRCSHSPGYLPDGKRFKFKPGIYSITANWKDKRYIFEPVDLTEERPETVVFKPKEIISGQVTFCGRIAHGITGSPIAGALVISGNFTNSVDASSMQPEDWQALKTRGLELDNNDQVVVPLIEALSYGQPGSGISQIAKIVRSDASGWFQIALDQAYLAGHSFINIRIIEKDFLMAEQSLRCPLPIDQLKRGQPDEKEFEKDQAGRTLLPPIKLFPAGTIIVEPNIPDFATGRTNRKSKFRLFWYPSSNETSAWLKESLMLPRENQGQRIAYKNELRPNVVQTAYIPADTEIALRIYNIYDFQWAPIVIPGIKLSHGQILDLGRLDFPKAVRVAVRVIDSKANPLNAVKVGYKNEFGKSVYGYQKPATNAQGLAWVYVPPNSKGKFFILHVRHGRLNEYPEESVPYQVSGQKDTGKQFTLVLSNEMLKRLSE